MSEPKEQVVSTLNELIATCKNGEKGFQTAAEGAKDPQLQALCLQYAKQRAQFVSELQQEVRQYDKKPTSSGTLAGALHRGWINVKSAVEGGNEDAIIAECERGEDEAKETYEKALNAYLPAQVAGLVQRQYTQVREAHDRFSAMQKAIR